MKPKNIAYKILLNSFNKQYPIETVFVTIKNNFKKATRQNRAMESAVLRYVRLNMVENRCLNITT